MYIDLKKGDTVLAGKFKNIPYVVKDFGTDDNNQPTIKTESGKTLKLLTVRIKKLMKEKLKKESLHEIKTVPPQEIEKRVLGLIHNIPYIDQAKLYSEVDAYVTDVENVIKDLERRNKIQKHKKSNGYYFTIKENTGMIKLKSLITEQSSFREDITKKVIQPNEELIATNESSYHWEYDTMIYYAMVFLNTKTEQLRLVITHTHIKSGLGKGEETKKELNLPVGLVTNPNKGQIRSSLTKYGYKSGRSTSSYKKWSAPGVTGEFSFDEILHNHY